jgi:hypothetical protein
VSQCEFRILTDPSNIASHNVSSYSPKTVTKSLPVWCNCPVTKPPYFGLTLGPPRAGSGTEKKEKKKEKEKPTHTHTRTHTPRNYSLAKNVYTKPERLTVSCTVPSAWSVSVNLYYPERRNHSHKVRYRTPFRNPEGPVICTGFTTLPSVGSAPHIYMYVCIHYVCTCKNTILKTLAEHSSRDIVTNMAHIYPQYKYV